MDVARTLQVGFVFLLSAVHVNLVLLEIIVVDLSRSFAVGFGGVAYAFLLSALLYALHVDDGAGRLYGSGIEAFFFVLFAQLLSYGAGFLMYDAYDASEFDSHVSGTAIGGFALVVPTAARVLSGRSNGGRNFRRGVLIAVLLEVLWLAIIILLRPVLDIEELGRSAGGSLRALIRPRPRPCDLEVPATAIPALTPSTHLQPQLE